MVQRRWRANEEIAGGGESEPVLTQPLTMMTRRKVRMMMMMMKMRSPERDRMPYSPMIYCGTTHHYM